MAARREGELCVWNTAEGQRKRLAGTLAGDKDSHYAGTVSRRFLL